MRGGCKQLAASGLHGALQPRCLRHQCHVQVLHRPRGALATCHAWKTIVGDLGALPFGGRRHVAAGGECADLEVRCQEVVAGCLGTHGQKEEGREGGDMSGERERRERDNRLQGEGQKRRKAREGKKDQGREEWRGGEERPEVRIEKCERSEKKRGKEEREGDLVCVALMPGDTTTFEDGQKRRRRDEWRETRECDKWLKKRCKKMGKSGRYSEKEERVRRRMWEFGESREEER